MKSIQQYDTQMSMSINFFSVAKISELLKVHRGVVESQYKIRK